MMLFVQNTCRICGKPGHWAKDCWKKQHVQEERSCRYECVSDVKAPVQVLESETHTDSDAPFKWVGGRLNINCGDGDWVVLPTMNGAS
eukprot:1178298-Karenia_brevis.AAC.1